MDEPIGPPDKGEPPDDPMSVAILIHAGADMEQFRPSPETEPLSPVWGTRFTADGQFEYLTKGDVHGKQVIATLQRILVEKYRNSCPLERAEIEQRIRDTSGDRAEVEIRWLRDTC